MLNQSKVSELKTLKFQVKTIPVNLRAIVSNLRGSEQIISYFYKMPNSILGVGLKRITQFKDKGFT
jgi:hypothetical protein